MHFNWANVAWDPYVEVRDMAYRNSRLYPLASGLDGSLVIVALQATGSIIDGIRWQGRFAYYRSHDASPWFTMTGMHLTSGFLARSPRRGEGAAGR